MTHHWDTRVLLLLAGFMQIHADPTISTSNRTPCYGDVVTLVCHHLEVASNPGRYVTAQPTWREDGVKITPSTGIYLHDDTSEDFTRTTLTINITVDHFSNKSFKYSCLLVLADEDGLPSGEVETSPEVTLNPVDTPLPPNITEIDSRDTNITLQWSHDSVCFENSVFQYLVTWGSTSGGPSKEVRTSASNITIATSTRQAHAVKVIAVGKFGTNEHQSEEVLVRVTADLPLVYGLDDQPCYDRSYALVCEHQYSGGSVWLVGEDQEPITQSSSLYTPTSTTLEIHNTSKAVTEGSEVYHCRVDLPTGTIVRGSGYILSPLSRPLKPEITSVNSGSYDITVAWKQSSHCYEQFQFTHEVQWKKESETEWSHSTLQPPGTEHTISGLSAATSYNIRVRAVAVDLKSSDTTLYSYFTEHDTVTSSEPLIISFGIIGSFLLISTIVLGTILAISCCRYHVSTNSQLKQRHKKDTKDAINSTNEDHHRSVPPNPLENESFERIENPSYQPLEMCHEKVTYSNL